MEHAKGSDAILTHVGLSPPLIKLMVSEHREDEVGVGGAGISNTYTHAYTHTVPRYTPDGDKIASDACSRLYTP